MRKPKKILAVLAISSALFLSGCSGPGAAGSPGAGHLEEKTASSSSDETISDDSKPALPAVSTALSSLFVAQSLYASNSEPVGIEYDATNQVWRVQIWDQKHLNQVLVSADGLQVVDKYLDDKALLKGQPTLPPSLSLSLGQSIVLALKSLSGGQSAYLVTAQLEYTVGSSTNLIPFFDLPVSKMGKKDRPGTGDNKTAGGENKKPTPGQPSSNETENNSAAPAASETNPNSAENFKYFWTITVDTGGKQTQSVQLELPQNTPSK